jgi:hypothetical protein
MSRRPACFYHNRVVLRSPNKDIRRSGPLRLYICLSRDAPLKIPGVAQIELFQACDVACFVLVKTLLPTAD